MSKICPTCANEVDANDKNCRHCAHTFIKTRSEIPQLFGGFRDALNRFLDFNNRTSRLSYWRFILANLIIVFSFLAIGIIVSMFGFLFDLPILAASISMLWVMISTAYSIVISLPLLAISIRRLHDQDRPAWYLLVNLIPWVGPLIFLLLMVFPGTADDNRYGPPPRSEVQAWKP